MNHHLGQMRLHRVVMAFVLLQVAVTTVEAQSHCKVRYQYNAAGDRVQRDWYCWTPGGQDDEEVVETRSLVSNLEEVHLEVMPNPTADFLRVQIPEAAQGGVLELVSTLGAVLTTASVVSGTVELDVSRYENGLYLIRLIKGSEMLISPFVIQR
jgi:hypothetical protein